MEREQNGFLQMIKGLIFTLAVSLIVATVFALLLRFTSLSDRIIYPVNQTLKGIIVCLGGLLFVRGEKGFLKGAGIGLLFSITSYLMFAIIGGDFSLSFLVVVEWILAVLIGAISGAVAVNLKKSG